MAEMVHDAFESHHHAIVEAGRGQGRRWRIFCRRFCSGRRVVISTATKSLQEQLYQKDIPFSAETFRAKPEGRSVKGRSNFLCISKLHQTVDQALLKGMESWNASARSRIGRK